MTSALASQEPLVTRILYFEGIAPIDAMRLLRNEGGARQIAVMTDLNALIVKGSPDRVARCESLLRDRNAIARTDDPHDPEPPPNRSDQIPSETRVFRIQGIDREDAIVVLRSIYGVRDLVLLPEGDTLSVTAQVPKLDNIEALLTALGVLAKVPS